MNHGGNIGGGCSHSAGGGNVSGGAGGGGGGRQEEEHSFAFWADSVVACDLDVGGKLSSTVIITTSRE